MTDNIKSLRVEFKDFVPEGRYKANEYFDSLSLPLEKKSVFLVANIKTKLRGFKGVAESLVKKGYTVFALPSVCEKVEGAVAVNGNSDEYFRAIATSRFVIAVDYLPDFFLKRDGQYVINAVPRSVSTLNERLGKARTDIKTDFKFRNKGELDSATQLKIMTALRFPEKTKRFISGKTADGKKKLVVAANLKNDNALELFRRIAAEHKDEYDVTLVVDQKSVDEYETDLFNLDESIVILTKQGNIMRKEEDDAKVKFLGGEYMYLENPKDVHDFLPEYIFDYERRKLFGSQSYDKAINILFVSFFWNWMLSDAAGSYVYIDNHNSRYMNEAHRIARSNVLSTFEKVYFTRGDFYELALSECEKLSKNASVLPYIPSYDESAEIKTVTLDGKKRLLLSVKNRGIFCSKQVSSAEYFDDKAANYTVVNNALSDDDNIEIINKMPTDKLLFVIDPFCLLQDNKAITGRENLVYMDSLKDFSVLLHRFDKCFVIGENKPLEDEAKRFGKEIVNYK